MTELTCPYFIYPVFAVWWALKPHIAANVSVDLVSTWTDTSDLIFSICKSRSNNRFWIRLTLIWMLVDLNYWWVWTSLLHRLRDILGVLRMIMHLLQETGFIWLFQDALLFILVNVPERNCNMTDPLLSNNMLLHDVIWVSVVEGDTAST